MKMILRMKRLLVSLVIFFLMTTLHAGTPVWTFTPLTATSISVVANKSETIVYTVTNKSKKVHSLEMKPIPGISASGNCSSPLGYLQSCTLTLLVNSNQLQGNVIGGPVLCQDGSLLQCYQPSLVNSLNIKKAFEVIPSTDGHGVISPDTPQTVDIGGSLTFNAIPNTNFTVYQWLLDGEIVQTGGASYTLSHITSNHTVMITFTSTLPVISVLPTTFDIPSGSDRSVIISNESPDFSIQNLNVVIVNGTGTVTPGAGSNCPLTLAANTSCTYFFHGVSAGTATATISGTNTLAPAVVHITVGAIPIVTLSSSVSTLALSVNDTNRNAALTGKPRQITITNTDPSNTAFGVMYNPSPDLPAGTTITPATCGDIPFHGTCVLTIIPGANPSAPAADTAPTPITLFIEGDNTNTLSPTINILTYGSVYQSGFVFAVDDTTPDTGSIGGKVASQTNQAQPDHNGIVWDSSSGCTTPPNNNCYTTNANSDSDGAGNTSTIYSVLTTSHGLAADTYAAGLCYGVDIGGYGYTDWYLPAVCEMGYSVPGGGTQCGTPLVPALQNMLSNLVANNIGSLAGYYWTSTDFSFNPQEYAFYQYYSSSNNFQAGTNKGIDMIGVRCVRALTY